jgi:hypothetical protein
MIAVTRHEGVLTKGLNRDNNQIWQFWPKIRLSASKWQIFAPVAGCYAFEANHHQNVLYRSTATTNEMLTLSRLPRQGDKNKILSGVSWSRRGVNLI